MNLADWFPSFLPYASTDLVDEDARQRLLKVARLLPYGLGCGTIAVECPLNGGGVDFLVSPPSHVQLPSEGAPWAAVREMRSHVSWLEFDASLESGAVPNLFVRGAGALQLGGEAVASLLTRPGVELGSVGVMLARRPSMRRVCLVLTTGEVGSLLTSIGMDAIDADRWMPPLERVWLDLDVNEAGRFGPRVGLEWRLIDPSGRIRQAAARLLDTLVADGLCSARARAALTNWGGRSSVADDPQAWPDVVVAEWVKDGRCRGHVRNAYLLKIVLQPGVTATAKAYLFVHPYMLGG